MSFPRRDRTMWQRQRVSEMDSRPKPKPHSVFVFEQVDPTEESLDWLEAQGMAVKRGRAMWKRGFRRYSEDEIIEAARGFDGLMGASGARFSRRVLEALPTLKCISKFGIGVDSIDVQAATELGILVSNTGGDLQITPVSEHTVAMMLALCKRLNVWTPQFMREGGWRADTYGSIITGSTIGIVGFGRIGRGVAERLAGWGVNIIAYDPFAKDIPASVTPVDLKTLLSSSDVITLHATPTKDNFQMINEAAFAQMKSSAVLVNTGRAALVDYAALRRALSTGQIAGAALDVFDLEPPLVTDPLFSMSNVIVSPHVAAWTHKGAQNMGIQGSRNLHAMLTGRGQASVVNAQPR